MAHFTPHTNQINLNRPFRSDDHDDVERGKMLISGVGQQDDVMVGTL